MSWSFSRCWLPAVAAALLLSLAACEDRDAHTAHTPAPQAAPAAAVAKQMCAVMPGHAVNGSISIEHEGKTIAFCCADCIPQFKKNPQKYLAAAQ